MSGSRQRNVLITGGAGFIGSTLADHLLLQGFQVVAFDNFNDYYSPDLKRRNIIQHREHPAFILVEGDIRQRQDMQRAFAHGPFDIVVHLAAMAGVRPSLLNPSLYMDVNVVGTQVLVDELLKTSPAARLVFGSSSSVYGARSGECFRETDRVDQPLSPYAASKAANEAQLYSIHHTTSLKIVCLRFFTVFGPRQRPDLAINKFCKAIEDGKPIEVYGDGTSKRDYTFVGDIVSGITSAMTFDLPGFEIINLGRGKPIFLMEMIKLLEAAMGKTTELVHKPMPAGDVPYTFADITKAGQLLGYNPQTSFEEGIGRFVEWRKQQHAGAL